MDLSSNFLYCPSLVFNCAAAGSGCSLCGGLRWKRERERGAGGGEETRRLTGESLSMLECHGDKLAHVRFTRDHDMSGMPSNMILVLRK
jgi:hypothetical protein